jgi:nitrite reductase (NADH) small subunit
MSSNKCWIRITPVKNIPLREGRAVNVAGREIALFNLGDRFLAVDARCPHNGGPLAEGIVTGTSVVCPLHAWKINLETGSVTKPDANPACVGTYATRIDSGVILIELPESAAEKPANHRFCGEHNLPAPNGAPSASPAP